MSQDAVPRQKLHCPACRTLRQVVNIGTATIHKRRHPLVQCTDKTCELIWATRYTT